MGKLSPHFTEDEFRCKDGCGTCFVDQDFLFKLETARSFYRRWIPDGVFQINSGCRCREHNASVGGVDSSQHLAVPEEDRKCNAADIKAANGRERFYMMKALFRAGFVGIGVADGYIHCDDGRYQPYRPSAWSY